MSEPGDVTANPWAAGGGLAGSATSSDATRVTALPTPTSNWWLLPVMDDKAIAAIDRLQKHGVSRECVVSSAAALYYESQDVSPQVWNEALLAAADLATAGRYRAGSTDDSYAEFPPCVRLLVMKLGAKLMRCGGLDLASDIFLYWLSGGKDGRASATDTITIEHGGAAISVTPTFFPLAWDELTAHYNASGPLNSAHAEAFDRMLGGAYDRIRQPNDLFPPGATFLLAPKENGVLDTTYGLKLDPVPTALAQGQREFIFTQTLVGFLDPELTTIGTSTLLSEFEVRAERVKVMPTEPPYSTDLMRIVPVSSVEPVDPNAVEYGYRIEIESSRSRLWDKYNFDPLKAQSLFGVQIGDSFFSDLEGAKSACPGSLAALAPTPFYILSDSWLDGEPHPVFGTTLYLPDSADKGQLGPGDSVRSLFRPTEDGDWLLPKSPFGY